MNSSIRLLIISDVRGAGSRHVGDEAMLEANLHALRRLIPNVALTIVSSDPAWAESRYGVDAVNLFGFSRAPAASPERCAMLDRLLAEAPSWGPEKQSTVATGHPLSSALAGTDGLVVSGGGNLSSTWPDLLYERVALLELARLLRKPAVILGQTIGPELTGQDRRLVAGALCSARFVGVRELPSAMLAQELGVLPERIWYQSDDALFLDGQPVSIPIGEARTPVIAVTLDPQIRAKGEILFDSLVCQLRKLSEITDTRLMLVPHVFGNESAGVPSDITEARLVADKLGPSNTVVAAGLDPGQARQLTGAAALVISTRYHPIVFALAAGIPSLGIFGDEYCRIKLQGALAHAGLERWTLTYDDVTRGELLSKALVLWDNRNEIRRELESHREAWRIEYAERWAAVLRALDPTTTQPPGSSDFIFGRPILEVGPALRFAQEPRSLENESGIGKAVRRYAAAAISKIRSIRP